MNRYRVEWTMDIEADSPEAAARQAFAHMQRPGTTANVFDVQQDDGSDAVRIDLEELDQAVQS